MTLGTEVGLSPGDIVSDGDPALNKMGTAPAQFSAHVCCGQMAGWIKMPLGTEVSLDPRHIVLVGTQLPPPPQKKWGTTSNFCLISIVAKRPD